MFEDNPIYDKISHELEQRIIISSPTALNETNVLLKPLKNLSKRWYIKKEYTDKILGEILADSKHPVDLR